MGWIPGLRAGVKTSQKLLTERAAQVAQQHDELDVLIFRLDADLDVQPLQGQLAAQLAAVGVQSKVAVAGPGRVHAVHSGVLAAGKQLLLVIGQGDDTVQDRLMDLVEWLIANGRENLAKQLIFIPLGATAGKPAAFPFAHVPLPRLNTSLNPKGGGPTSWLTTPGKSDPLLQAVLDQALGLE